MTNITLRRSPYRTPRLSLFDRDFLGPTMSRLLDFETPIPRDSESVGMMPPVEIAESDTEFTCTAELPGLSEKDVEVCFEDGELRIKGEKHAEKETKANGNRYHIFERSYGAFERSFNFPSDVDASKIAAEFKSGVLKVRLPKSPDSKRAGRTIPLVTK